MVLETRVILETRHGRGGDASIRRLSGLWRVCRWAVWWALGLMSGAGGEGLMNPFPHPLFCMGGNAYSLSLSESESLSRPSRTSPYQWSNPRDRNHDKWQKCSIVVNAKPDKRSTHPSKIWFWNRQFQQWQLPVIIWVRNLVKALSYVTIPMVKPLWQKSWQMTEM